MKNETAHLLYIILVLDYYIMSKKKLIKIILMHLRLMYAELTRLEVHTDFYSKLKMILLLFIKIRIYIYFYNVPKFLHSSIIDHNRYFNTS